MDPVSSVAPDTGSADKCASTNCYLGGRLADLLLVDRDKTLLDRVSSLSVSSSIGSRQVVISVTHNQILLLCKPMVLLKEGIFSRISGKRY